VNQVRELLRQDPVWCAYALGDLDPRRAQYCEWFVRGESVALLYHEFDPPILFASGDPAVLDGIPYHGPCHLQVPQHGFVERFGVDWQRPMRRLGLDPADFRPRSADAAAVEPLTEAHEAEIRELYRDGVERREEPDFFIASQLGDGTFFGIRDPREPGRLAAAGGTHLLSDSESVATIGNVYARRSHRGMGYGTAVTSAIASNLVGRGIQTIALNVKSQNVVAIRIYEQLGFRFRCDYAEAFARNMKKL
jgi:ribosomal protein S18 acetylase RimI-like enzyme